MPVLLPLRSLAEKIVRLLSVKDSTDLYGSLCPVGMERPRRTRMRKGHRIWCLAAWKSLSSGSLTVA